MLKYLLFFQFFFPKNNNKELANFKIKIEIFIEYTILNSLSAFFLFNFSSGVSSFGLIDSIDKADITDLELDFGTSLLSKIFNACAVSLFCNIGTPVLGFILIF